MRMHRHRLITVLLCTALLGISTSARADVFVFVHASNPLQQLTPKQAVDLYMGRSRAFPMGELATALDLAPNDPTREAFYRSLTGMGPAQINSYWSRLIFSGQTLPPRAVSSEAEVFEVVVRNPGAIGYASRQPTDPTLRVVLVLKDKDPR